MNDVLKTVFDANLATLLIVASLAFLFIAVAGSVAGKIDPGKAGRIGAGVIGAVLLALGIVLRVSAPGSTPGEDAGVANAEVAAPAAAVPDEARRAEEQRQAEEQRRLEAQVEAQRLAQQQTPPRETTPATTPVAPGARFFGTLLYLRGTDRVPLASARVELRAPGESAALYSTTSNAAGDYSFPKVLPGTYQVSVRYRDVPLAVIVPAKPIQVREGSAGRRITITVER